MSDSCARVMEAEISVSFCDNLRWYIQSNYGKCVQSSDCACLKPGSEWLGLACPNWRPVKASSWDELRQEMQSSSAPSPVATGAA